MFPTKIPDNLPRIKKPQKKKRPNQLHPSPPTKAGMEREERPASSQSEFRSKSEDCPSD